MDCAIEVILLGEVAHKRKSPANICLFVVCLFVCLFHFLLVCFFRFAVNLFSIYSVQGSVAIYHVCHKD